MSVDDAAALAARPLQLRLGRKQLGHVELIHILTVNKERMAFRALTLEAKLFIQRRGARVSDVYG
jgi:hypothetical protein